jgi:hypothetical protein
MPKKFLLIWLMPWAEFSETLSFGDIQIWNFYKDGPARVQDSQQMLWLAQFISCFRNHNGDELRNVAIVQIGENPFGGWGKNGNYKVRWAANAIAFAHIAGGIRNFLAGSVNAYAIDNSERFQLMQVQIDEEGKLHYSKPGTQGISDVADKHVLFHEPSQNVFKFGVPDRLLLKGLAKINDEQGGTDLWRKLRVCFEWFANGWTLSENLSTPARFVSLSTSFESLAKQTIDDNAVSMAAYAAHRCEFTNLPKVGKITYGRRKKTTLTVTKPEQFIFEFAQYRNSFVHGDMLPWGLIKHTIGTHEFDPRQVMSMVIYSLVVRMLLDANAWSIEAERVKMQQDLRNVVKSLQWHTQTKIGLSPHVGYTSHNSYA